MPRFRQRFARLNCFDRLSPIFEIRRLVQRVPDLADVAKDQVLPKVSPVEDFFGAVDDTRLIEVLAANFFRQYLPAKRAAEPVGNLFDCVLEDRVRLHRAEGAKGRVAWLIAAVDRAIGLQRFHAIAAVRLKQTQIHDGERTVVRVAGVGFQIEMQPLDDAFRRVGDMIIALVRMPFANHQHVGGPVIQQTNGAIQLPRRHSGLRAN